MVSNTRETREKQMALYENQLNERIAVLKEKNTTEAKIAKDSIVKKIKALIRDSKNRIKSIEKKEEILLEAKRKKEEAAEAKKNTDKKDKKKKAQEEKPEGGKKKKKEKKKDNQ